MHKNIDGLEVPEDLLEDDCSKWTVVLLKGSYPIFSSHFNFFFSSCILFFSWFMYQKPVIIHFYMTNFHPLSLWHVSLWYDTSLLLNRLQKCFSRLPARFLSDFTAVNQPEWRGCYCKGFERGLCLHGESNLSTLRGTLQYVEHPQPHPPPSARSRGQAVNFNRFSTLLLLVAVLVTLWLHLRFNVS